MIQVNIPSVFSYCLHHMDIRNRSLTLNGTFGNDVSSWSAEDIRIEWAVMIFGGLKVQQLKDLSFAKTPLSPPA